MSTFATKNVAVLGSTGSIGTSALEVIGSSDGQLRTIALSAHAKLDQLVAQAREVNPRWVIATDHEAAENYDWTNLPPETKLLVGDAGLRQVVQCPDVDIVLAGIVGSAGLCSTWNALEARKTVALANKETLVMGGQLIVQLAEEYNARILPVDSEHCAIFQALRAGRVQEVERIILTASGGPFRGASQDELLQVTISDALEHPTWNMGPKITIDSATMMNKALEIIEARWLFGVPAERIEVVIHPQSVVHSLVEFIDGSVMAQMSLPDMKLPIQYALCHPDRKPRVVDPINWSNPMHFDFEPPDPERFPALELGYQCARSGGTSGAVLNAANEAAVEAFLEGKLHFTEIVAACRSVLEEHVFVANPSLEELISCDDWARNEISRWVCA